MVLRSKLPFQIRCWVIRALIANGFLFVLSTYNPLSLQLTNSMKKRSKQQPKNTTHHTQIMLLSLIRNLVTLSLCHYVRGNRFLISPFNAARQLQSEENFVPRRATNDDDLDEKIGDAQ